MNVFRSASTINSHCFCGRSPTCSDKDVTVFEAAIAPMIGASIVAIDHELDPPLVTLMVGLGIPLSFVTLPVWWRLLATI